MEEPAEHQGKSRERHWALPVAMLLAAVIALYGFQMRQKRPIAKQPQDQESMSQVDKLILEADQLLNDERYQESERKAREVLEQAPGQSPEHGRALLVLALATEKQQRFEEALDFFSRIPSDHQHYAMALSFKGDLLFYRMGRPSDAEKVYRQVLSISPNEPFTLSNFSYLLGIHGRRWESVPYLHRLIRLERVSHQQLLWLGVLDIVIDNADLLEKGHQSSPDDPLPQIGLARLALRDNNPQKAKELLQQAIQRVPDEIEAQACLGKALFELGADEEFLNWHRQLPEQANQHPEIWVIRGDWARQDGQTRQAIRCFAESLRLDPNRQPASYQLAHLLAKVGEQEIADQVAQRAARLVELTHALSLLEESPEQIASIRAAVDLLEQLGRYWEATSWSARALTIDPQLDWPKQSIMRFAPKLIPGAPLVDPAHVPTRKLNLSDYPLPKWNSIGSATLPPLEGGAKTSEIQFAEMRQEAELNFNYFNGQLPDELTYFHEQLGGGVATLDFDVDGWPDVYLTQGCKFASRGKQTVHLDRLFRNMGDGTFRNVTLATGLYENNYSQGVTVGDFNNDGFPDVFVANIGANQLFENMGDGTFQNVTDQAGIKGEDWTTSCVIADLTGDGLPDIYAVNYLQGKDIFTRPCPCTPGEYSGAQDRLYVSLGDGRFEDRTSQAGLLARNGKGLGVVVADFDHSGKLGLFVANDAVANFFFVPENDSSGSEIKFVDIGVLSGLAFDQKGRVQNCMGVAVGDANQNGLLDLFITNFYRQSNTLFVQQSSLSFIDSTRRAELGNPSLMLLGWGTQFIDGDLDGRPDLVVTNGHVEKRAGEPFKMRPQCFHNQGGGRFVELSREALGDYFQRDYVGRSMARLDWNRDGREDFVVSNIGGPASLATNQTKNVGHFFAIQLRGTESARDAIGATVWVSVGEQTWMQQLTAGDGYQASNEKRLLFGLADHDKIDELKIRWPNGKEQAWNELPVDSQWIAIEGAAELYRQ